MATVILGRKVNEVAAGRYSERTENSKEFNLLFGQIVDSIRVKEWDN